MDTPHMRVRKAEIEDIPVLERLIPESVRGLQAADYTPEQMEGAIGTVFGVDTQLIRDGTYLVVEVNSEIVACGGWSRRRTLFGSDHGPVKDDDLLDPATEPARIRAFFVHPAWSRQGIARRILNACETAARAEGFHLLELASTLTGIPLYQNQGFEPIESVEVPLKNGATLPVLKMRKPL